MASMEKKDYYSILDVESQATTEEIRKAFQKKAVKLHPDVNKEAGAEERFKELSEAYAVLSDPDKRARYDAMRSNNPFASGMPHESYGGYAGGWSQGTVGSTGPFSWGFPFGQASYNARRRTSSRAYNPKAGSDILYELELDHESARLGCRRAVNYQRYTRCESCAGSGSVSHAGATSCPSCSGSGFVTVAVPAELAFLFGGQTMRVACPECEGTGKVVLEPCSRCSGTGRQVGVSELVVEVEPGAHDGQEIRYEGKGNVGTNNSATGDFVCLVGIPAERLSQRSAAGFSFLGWLVGALAPSILTQTFLSTLLRFSVLFIFALAVILTSGVLGHSKQWWKNALKTFANSFSHGLIIGLFFTALFSCSGSLGRQSFNSVASMQNAGGTWLS